MRYMALSTALELLFMDGKFTLEKETTNGLDYLVVYAADSGDKIATIIIVVSEFDNQRYVSHANISELLA